MKINNKLIAIAVAGALTAPAAFAAQDTSGMQYTSASEGFYASIRVRYDSNNGTEDGDAKVGNSGSRFGVRGSNDLGGGLSGFYQYEAGVDTANGGALSTRIGHVGLRGGFGEIILGNFWPNAYNFTNAGSDVSNVYSAYITPTHQQYRTSNTIQYTTPEISGLQVALAVRMRGGATTDNVYEGDNADALNDAFVNDESTNPDGNDVDLYSIAAKYAAGGLSVGLSYNSAADALVGGDDGTSWVAKLGYAQDNWYANYWYSEDNASDGDGVADDRTVAGLGAGISLDKINLYLSSEADDTATGDNAYTTLGAQYNLGSNSRVWLEYVTVDNDGSDVEDDHVNMGLRHDF